MKAYTGSVFFHLVFLLLWAGVSGTVSAQTPIGSEFRVNQDVPSYQTDASLGFDKSGRFVIVWQNFVNIEDPEDPSAGFYEARATRYSASGQLLGESILEVNAGRPLLAGTGGNTFTVIWGADSPQGGDIFGHRFHWSSGEQVETEFALHTPAEQRASHWEAAELPSGGLFVTWIGDDKPFDPRCSRCEYGAFARIIDHQGQPVTAAFRIHKNPDGTQVPTGVSADAAGNVVVTWWSNPRGDGSNTDVMAQRFSSSGKRLGPEFRVNPFSLDEQASASVASAPFGDFVITWVGSPRRGNVFSIFAQRFSKNGKGLGQEFRVNTGRYSLFPQIAVDRFGNFVIVWQSFIVEHARDWDIKGQLYRKDGTPVGREFLVNMNTDNAQEKPRVAFGPNGTFVVAWENFNGSDLDIFAQRFAASPGAEPCVVRGARLLCDTGRTGGDGELELTFGGRPDETLLAGDYDGDGREDLCAHYLDRFRCDLDHRGAPAEVGAKLGQAGDVPLMGDLDGDGRADFCVRRQERFLCDTGHNGGSAETGITFGTVSDLPLLGDLNGDGRDEPCVWRSGSFLCDTARNGGTAEVTIAFGQAGDIPLLGDFDGDGDDDPCVFRSGRFLCDTAHDGGVAEEELVFGQAGDRPLLSNFDGL
jgi:hypothetical protein